MVRTTWKSANPSARVDSWHVDRMSLHAPHPQTEGIEYLNAKGRLKDANTVIATDTMGLVRYFVTDG